MNPILQIIGYVKVICGPPHYCADLPHDSQAVFLLLIGLDMGENGNSGAEFMNFMVRKSSNLLGWYGRMQQRWKFRASTSSNF